MNTAFDVAVRLSMETSGFASAASMATRLLGDLEGKAGGAEATVAKLARRFNLPTDQFVAQATSMGRYTTEIEAMTAAHATLGTAMGGIGRLAAGAGLVGIGAAGVGIMKGWIGAAGELQSAMAGVQLATLGVGSALQQASQLTALQDMTYSVAAKTRFSAPDIASIEKLAATSGLNKRTDLISALPTLANAAEVSLHMKGVSYQQSVPAFVAVAHQFQAYGGKKFNNLLDLMGRASVVSGDTPESMARTLSYLAPSVNAYGLSPEDAISTAALASNVGLSGGHGGGSRIQAMFRSIAPLMSSRGSMHNRSIARIERLGGSDFFKNGNFEEAGGVTNLLTTVMRALQRIPDQAKRMSLLTSAFGSAGGTALSSLASPGAITRFQAIQGDLAPHGGIASTSQMQQVFNSTLAGQTATLSTNMSSLSAIMGQQLLPILTPIVHGIVEMTGALVGFLAHHKQVAQFAAVFTLVGSAAAIVVGGVLALSGALTLMSLAAAPLGLELLPITALIVGVGAAAAAGVWVWQHWGTIVKWVGGVLSGVGGQVGAFISLAGDLLGVFGQIGGALAQDLGLDKLFAMLVRVEGAWLHFLDTTLHLKDALRWAGSALQSFLRWLGVLHDGPKKNAHPVTVRPAVAPKPGSVHATATRDGTVGLPTTLYLPPITASKGRGSVPVPHGLPGPGPAARALLPRTRQAAPAWSIPVAVAVPGPVAPRLSPARHPVHTAPPAPRRPLIPASPRHAVGVVPASRAAAPVHNHYDHRTFTVAKDAIVNHITPHPGQSPAQIGDHVSQATIKAITKELADALSRGGHGYKGLIPSSNAQW